MQSFVSLSLLQHGISKDSTESPVPAARADIFKRLWSPGIGSKELIPPAYVA